MTPKRNLGLFGSWFGFKADSIIPGQGERVFVWWRNFTDGYENFLKTQARLLRENSIEIRMGPSLDLNKSLLAKRPIVAALSPGGEEGYGVYVEEGQRLMLSQPISLHSNPFGGEFAPGP